MTTEYKLVQVLNLKRLQALETWLQKTNTKLTRVNGQRKYGGPPEVWDGPTPGAHCEVFIGRIPREAYEDLLIPLFSSVGALWEFRLMMNFSGQNRGFAYAKYGSAAVAAEAIRQLNGHMLEPGYRLLVCHSTEKRHLCIGDLPATTTDEDLLQALRLLSDGVESVSLKTDGGVSAVVAFSSHRAASMANKVLIPAFRKQFATKVTVKWQLTEKPSPDEPRCPQKPANSLSASPSRPPRYVLSSPQPPGPSLPVSVPSVGGAAAPQCPHAECFSSTHRFLGFAASPVMVLHELCIGQPFYEVQYSHAGITAAFKGLTMTLPGSNGSTVREEAHMAAAQEVLQRLSG